MNKLAAILNLFRKGAMVTNPAAWKNVAIVTSTLSALSGLLVAFGALPHDIDQGTLEAIGGGIVAIVSLFVGGLHVTTSEKVGFAMRPGDEGGDEHEPKMPESKRSPGHHPLDHY